jgi:hypothetical protein
MLSASSADRALALLITAVHPFRIAPHRSPQVGHFDPCAAACSAV